MVARVVPLIDRRFLDRAERSQVQRIDEHFSAAGDDWLRNKILREDRVDLLMTQVLGLQCRPFHRLMLRHQFEHPQSLVLAYRGSGKSTACTISRIVHLLCKNRDLRIVIASKTTSMAKTFLDEIKKHLESNETLIRLFGEFYDPRKVGKWNDTEIEVLGRTRPAKEASVTCIGVQGAVVGKHYDVAFPDDLVDEENSRTKYRRDALKSWYYQAFDPCMEPPDPAVPHRGERHASGTRYHFDDIYQHWMDNELKGHVLKFPALDQHGRSPWPGKHPPEWFEEKKRNAGVIVFGAQFMVDTEAMKGEVFQYDDIQMVEAPDVPTKLRCFTGVDLAISEADDADHFGIVDIGVDPKTENVYVFEAEEGQFRFSEQTRLILKHNRDNGSLRVGIEVNGYQKAQLHNTQDEAQKQGETIHFKPVRTDKDKLTRAWKLSPLFEKKKVFFVRRGGRLSKGLATLVDQLVLFPGHRYKDLFDALDLAVTASKMKRRVRGREPGLI